MKKPAPIDSYEGRMALEICEFCEEPQVPRHQGCPKRPYDVITGSFSPTKAVKCPPAKNLWTWRRLANGAFSLQVKVARRMWDQNGRLIFGRLDRVWVRGTCLGSNAEPMAKVDVGSGRYWQTFAVHFFGENGWQAQAHSDLVEFSCEVYFDGGISNGRQRRPSRGRGVRNRHLHEVAS